MSNFPDFSTHGYRVKGKLGSNSAGGRVTYLAIDLDTFKKVVIKQFQFAKSGSSWADYDSYRREIQILKGLHHPGICRYLSSFQTSDGFCMVQEYKDALSLAASRSFSMDEIQQIAIAVLEILIYLQKRIPPIIHRDIKPENILVDEHNHVYLIDFGFARVGSGEVGNSSVVKGTLGFMPPEQLFNQQLTQGSDLYGLGMTLICILTNTKSTEIGDLLDNTYRVNFSHLVSEVNIRWVEWLQKMTEPKLQDRYPDAVAALTEIPKESIYLPEIKLSQLNVRFRPIHRREISTQSITIDNLICGTLLQGIWQVAPHPSDPPSSNTHRWISVQPTVFEGNHVRCQITVDTNQLMLGKTYHRELLLHNNSPKSPYRLTLQVQTPPASVRVRNLPYRFLVLLFLFALTASWAFVQTLLTISSESPLADSFAAITGTSIGLEGAAWAMAILGAVTGATAGVIAGVVVGLIALFMVATERLSESIHLSIVGVIVGFVGGVVAGALTGAIAEALLKRGVGREYSIALAVLTIAAAASVGVGLTASFSQPVVLAITALTNLSLFVSLAYSPLKQVKSMRNRQNSERHLIRP